MGPARRIAELLVHLGRAARNEDTRSRLTAAQWTCLRFFASANGSTRTPSGFAQFQATTRGTASQTIKTLERRGLIARHKSATDGRSVRFDLTPDGQAMLAEDPLRDLVASIGDLAPDQRANLLEALSHLTVSLAGARQTRAFGTCSDCTHFTPTNGSGYCACMAVALAADEIDRLCASYDGPVREPHMKEGHTE
ncbi:MarR family winged helix-turn-helix transcriptional regulator [Roseovarius sp. D22-M7]|uniref:MarR family winged helix-turn-helix transcriptional regulator n=1 Tax=Roseovarius sp. D22-M7 TaxID=3127116 RepID=UPI00300FE05E